MWLWAGCSTFLFSQLAHLKNEDSDSSLSKIVMRYIIILIQCREYVALLPPLMLSLYVALIYSCISFHVCINVPYVCAYLHVYWLVLAAVYVCICIYVWAKG